MGKRSSYNRLPQDKYYTRDVRAVRPLLRHLPPGSRFIEPCAGAGHLRDHLEAAGHVCVQALDIAPEGPGIKAADALSAPLAPCDFIITNAPWDRPILHAMLARFSAHAPTWSLHDANWVNTGQARAFEGVLRAVQPVGRIKWIPDSAHDGGKEDCAWHLFDAAGAPSAFAALYLREAS